MERPAEARRWAVARWSLLLAAACSDRAPAPTLQLIESVSIETRAATGSMVVLGDRVFTASTVFSIVDLYLLDGDLVLSSSVAVGNGPRALAAGDLDGDGTFEVATADTGGRSVTILSASAAVSSSIALEREPIDVVLVDLDGDARAEIATIIGLKEAETSLVVLGRAQFDLPGATVVSAADVDRDGDQDLVVIQPPRSSLTVVVNGSAVGDTVEVCEQPSSAVVWEDRLAIGCRSGGVDLVSVSNLRDRVHQEGGSSIYDLAVGDFDGDGFNDLAGVDPFSHALFVWRGSEDGLSAPIEIAVSRGPVAVAALDYQEDGDPDLIVLAFEERRLDLIANETPQRRER